MRILLAQLNPTIGDLAGNTARILQALQKGRLQKASIVLFSEMVLSGYPPEDLLLLPHFINAIEEHLQKIIAATEGLTAIVGLPRLNPRGREKKLYNSAAIIQDTKLLGFYDKVLLPTYDVFDERRYFEPGLCLSSPLWNIHGKKIAITICEDIWQHAGLIAATDYLRDPIQDLKEKKPELVLNLSASPYSINKFSLRLETCLATSRTLNCPLLFCNQVGGNDSLIFDGTSLYVRPEGPIKQARSFVEDEILIDLSTPPSVISLERNEIHDLYQALVLGVRDYFRKIGLKKACLGLSGGIDSAVTACIAAVALGPENLLTLFMPSKYTSSESKRDADLLAKRLGFEHYEIPIDKIVESYLELLHPYFQGKREDITEENLQARARGTLLMAFANKLGLVVLNTGNKSELAVGYSTLYGDMCGGLAVINDLTKQQVYTLAEWINKEQEIIPKYTLERPPSAELRPGQKDSDSLPDYSLLDQALSTYIEHHLSPMEIAKKLDQPLELVEKIVRMIHHSEYKRRQAPPGLRISEKAFSIGRRFPIMQKWVT